MSTLKLPMYQVDAFAGRVFTGNPAAVCPLESWLPDAQMQSIAAENNLAETAFFVKNGSGYKLRWFTPAVEVDLCGHATLASASVILNDITPGERSVSFETKSGTLTVTREGDLYSLDFPARPPEVCANVYPGLVAAVGGKPETVLAAQDYFLVYGSEDELRSLRPDMAALMNIDRFAVIVTAPGREFDFVSRFFAPAKGVPEDPVTGRAHCSLIPYWSKRLGKKKLRAHQASPRGGEVWCEDRGERVTISGKAVRFFEGSIFL
ncbi:MAG TPA: PhzF family phenazine biosynthesis protein [Bryobacteraceae bacterium]|jgi:PhzF family phenazine biosynthesis protein|nr:PhzF family phenazine biosynthesis protein [Bryobacteraceae bacterium]